jgi:hypothetical protein
MRETALESAQEVSLPMSNQRKEVEHQRFAVVPPNASSEKLRNGYSLLLLRRGLQVVIESDSASSTWKHIAGSGATGLMNVLVMRKIS